MTLPPGPMMLADLVGLDVDRGDPGSELRHLGAGARRWSWPSRPRMWIRPARACSMAVAMISRLTPVILQSIWKAVMPSRRTRDLEVHVAEVVLVAQDVGQDGEVVALLDPGPWRFRQPDALIGTPASISARLSSRTRSPSRTSRWTRGTSAVLRITYGKSSLRPAAPCPRPRCARAPCPTSRRFGARSGRASPVENGGNVVGAASTGARSLTRVGSSMR